MTRAQIKHKEDHISYCRFCKSHNITPVKIVCRYGPRIKTMFCCPICGEYLDVVWKKEKRSLLER